MTHRPDIQALRGWAVALVVLYHAGVPGLSAGYLGVDLFFAVSGYLITGLVREAVDAGRFSLAGFWLRRLWRLMPAALVTLAATTLGAAALLDAPEWRDYQAQLAGALGWSANLVLWGQGGYFAGAAAEKPLLHTWSLAVEEQYYLLLPPLLVWVVPRLRWRAVVAALSLASLGLMAWLQQHAPDAAFYLLPARAWALGLGAWVALGPAGGPAPTPPHRTAWARGLAMAVLVALPLWPWPQQLGPHPGLAAAGMVAATAVLLRLPGPVPAGRMLGRLLVWLGDRSYALYLVHWPLLALLQHAWMGSPGPGQPGGNNSLSL
ncbi:acyltransferase family protein [Ideonella livida]|uniref:Acyltransferase n=1 Tax=Ideonella livida TaxID=2707176 RepID=A0A7C9PIN6_9BURK|nr:acyltransferase [Ideonella livida]NDY92896.1 acyltransferase [Ideonella livida]